jgi:hypothetical protein
LLCSRCGHDNPEVNRYCAMCGLRLATPPAKPPESASPDQAPKSARPAPAATSVRGQQPSPPPRRPAAPASGLSFLGLGGEPADTSYLLVEPERRGHLGLWITLLLLIALGAAGWYFRAELRPRAEQLYAAVLQRVNPQPPVPAAPAAPETNPASPEPSAPPAAAATPETAPQPAAAPTPPPKPEEKPAPAVSEKSAEPAQPAATVKDVAPQKNTERTAKYTRASRPKPADEVAPENDPLLQLAQKYLHGQGIPRDCKTGLAYLREAMKRPNYAAASQMGALYATGTCVPLDRLAAYRHFTAALQMDPSNPWLAQERDELYGRMTSDERRQADRQ